MRFVDIHILQSFPPSNLNRDDTGSPKDAIFGGVRRARISSQSLKRATRRAFAEQGIASRDLAVRTKRLIGEVADRLSSPEDDEETRAGTAELVRKVLAAMQFKVNDKDLTSYLLFLGSEEIDRIADVVNEHRDALATSEASKVLNKKELAALLRDTTASVDLALFGRMVADRPEINIEGAASVAHALSTHAVEMESDYYTALDDLLGADQTGADMIGMVDFNAAVFYRYATLDLRQLAANLTGDPDKSRQAVEAFLTCFAAAIPTGKQHSFAAYTPPSVVLVNLRSDQPLNLANAFERPVHVRAENTLHGYLTGSASALAEHWADLHHLLGTRTGDYLGLATLASLHKHLDTLRSATTLTEGSIPQVIDGAVARIGQN
jgi:CRISPR system Cascade subunit CasC